MVSKPVLVLVHNEIEQEMSRTCKKQRNLANIQVLEYLKLLNQV